MNKHKKFELFRLENFCHICGKEITTEMINPNGIVHIECLELIKREDIENET